MRDRAHERPVRPAHVRVDHLVVPLVHRQVDRLAHRATRVMQVRRGVRELHEVAEVLDRPVPAPLVHVQHERRAVRRREHRVHATDLDVVRRVARVLRERRGRARLDRSSAPARAGTARGPRPRRRRRRPAGARTASGASRKTMPTSSRIVSALCSRSSSPSSESTSNGFSVRVRNGTRSTCGGQARGLASGPSAGPASPGLGHR